MHNDEAFQTVVDPVTNAFLGLVDPVTGEMLKGTEDEFVRCLPDRLLPPWLQGRKAPPPARAGAESKNTAAGTSTQRFSRARGGRNRA